MSSDDDRLRNLKRKLEEVLGKENARTLMDLLIGEYRNEMLDRSPSSSGSETSPSGPGAFSR